MNKRLTAKVQKITPSLPKASKDFAGALEIIPDNDVLLQKKGAIYAVFCVTSPKNMDTTLATQVIHDVLHESYYQSENISPIQSLEKAISDAKSKVVTLAGETAAATFNFVGGVLWGNVLYLVLHGEGTGFITRGSATKPVGFTPEGSFAAASGVVKNDDVVVLSTKTFAELYPPEKLYGATHESLAELPASAGGIMLKFAVENTLSEQEHIEIGLPKTRVSKRWLKKLTNFTKKAPAKAKPETFTIKPAKTIAKKLNPRLLIPLVATALIGAIGYTLIAKSKPAKQLPADSSQQFSNTTPHKEESSEQEKIDERLETVPTEILYDTKLIDERIVPTGIAIAEDTIVIVDKQSGYIYTSKKDPIDFSAVQQTFPGISSVLALGNKLHFADTAGYAVYNLATDTVEEEYPLENVGISYTYLDFIYEINGDLLTKYTKEGDSLTSSTWAQSDDFKNAKDMVIAISIYILTGNNTVVKYTSGEKDEFEITDLVDPIQMVTNLDAENIYIADRGIQGVALFNKDGTLVKKITSEEKGLWSDIKGIDVDTHEENLYVLSGNKIFEVKL